MMKGMMKVSATKIAVGGRHDDGVGNKIAFEFTQINADYDKFLDMFDHEFFFQLRRAVGIPQKAKDESTTNSSMNLEEMADMCDPKEYKLQIDDVE